MGDHWNGQGKDEGMSESGRENVRSRANDEREFDEYDEFTEDQDDEEDINDEEDSTF
jgi:hypothetical protein